MDDLVLFSNSEKGMVRVKRGLNDNFPMTDFGGDGGDPWDQSWKDRKLRTLKIFLKDINLIVAWFHMQDTSFVSINNQINGTHRIYQIPMVDTRIYGSTNAWVNSQYHTLMEHWWPSNIYYDEGWRSNLSAWQWSRPQGLYGLRKLIRCSVAMINQESW